MTNSPREIESVLLRLRTDDPPVQRAVKFDVVNELRRMDQAAVKAMLSEALKDSEAEYRCTIAWAFLVLDFTSALEPVRQLLLKDSDDGVRGYVCEILGASKRPEAVPLLIEALQQDEDGTNRLVAAHGLGYIGDPAALPALKAAAESDEGVDYEGRPVKKTAAKAIRRITQEKAAASVA
ncbi:MAG: HEAT repeat domain-containing protein [Planctomycetes bacterium]|nr:HEAT repeat domain-containing protein [Planctomycetota bacterium]